MKHYRTLLVASLFTAVALAAAGCTPKKDKPNEAASASSVVHPASGDGAGRGAKAMHITSQSFSPNGSIPTRYTCEGENVSPELSWSGAPQGTRSYALIVDDPDAPDPKAPKRTWVHWVLYDIPPGSHTLQQNVQKLPQGTREGTNDFKHVGYGGPCPPIGRHRYFFKIYALNVELGDLGQPDKARLEQAIKGHVLAKGELIGTYAKVK